MPLIAKTATLTMSSWPACLPACLPVCQNFLWAVNSKYGENAVQHAGQSSQFTYCHWCHDAFSCVEWTSGSVDLVCFLRFDFNRAVSEERGTPMNTRVMCVILKFQPKEKLDHVGASTSRGSGQLSIMSVSAPGHLGKYPHYSFGCLQEFDSVYIQQWPPPSVKIPELCAQPWLLLLKRFT